MRISIIGLGYVGSIAMAGLAHLGHTVVGLDVNPIKNALVQAGQPPVQEPGLAALFAQGYASGRIQAATHVAQAVAMTDLSLICTGTPALPDGALDDRQLRQAITEVGAACRLKNSHHVIAVRSTALPETHRVLMNLLAESGLQVGVDVSYVVHPEFLREGSGVDDFFNPALIIFGGALPQDRPVLAALYPGFSTPVQYVDAATAALAKYADNLFHATKITFANEIGRLCSAQQVNSDAVMDLVVSNTRFNRSAAYLRSGLPFGGSCLPKDLRAILQWSAQHDLALPMLAGIWQSNEQQTQDILDQLAWMEQHKFLLIGLAFKPGSDDLRESPLVKFARGLLERGKELKIFAPGLMMERLVGANREFILNHLPQLDDLLVEQLALGVAWAEVVLVGQPLAEEEWHCVQAAQVAVVDFTCLTHSCERDTSQSGEAPPAGKGRSAKAGPLSCGLPFGLPFGRAKRRAKRRVRIMPLVKS